MAADHTATGSLGRSVTTDGTRSGNLTTRRAGLKITIPRVKILEILACDQPCGT